MLTQITQGSCVAYTRASGEFGVPKRLYNRKRADGVNFIEAWEGLEGIVWIIGHHDAECDAVKALLANAVLAER